MKRTIAVLLLLSVCGCRLDDTPCDSEADAKKAASYFEQCILANQRGDGGLGCGATAYDTFRKAK
jgi:hypothetical protein